VPEAKLEMEIYGCTVGRQRIGLDPVRPEAAERVVQDGRQGLGHGAFAPEPGKQLVAYLGAGAAAVEVPWAARSDDLSAAPRFQDPVSTAP
jgi:hypothetical protein